MKIQSFLLAVIIAAGISHVSVSRAMELDFGFAGNGMAIINLSSDRPDFITAIDIQADGKIVVGGYWGQRPDHVRIALVRYLPDGELDTDFGANGVIDGNLTEDTDELYSIVVQNDGGILVGFVGSDDDGVSPTLRNLVARYTPAGELDTNFDGDGILVVPNTESGFGELIVQADGKFLVCGQLGDVDDGSHAYVARFNSDGSADPDFGDGGIFSIGLVNAVDQCGSIMVLSDGSILVGARTYTDASPNNLSQIVVFKLSSAGALINGFGSDANGMFTHDTGEWIRNVDDLVELGDGRLMLLSMDESVTSYLLMLQPDGSLDTGFGDAGVVEINSRVTDLLLLPNGKVMISGQGIDGRAFFQVYNDDGSLEPSFGGNGRQAIGLHPVSAATKMILQDDGKIVVGGKVETVDIDNHAFLTMRFFDPDPDVDGAMDMDNCPNAANADQSDSDDNGIGDICDASPDPVEDDDNNGSAGSSSNSGGDAGGGSSSGGGGGSAGAWFISFLTLLVCLRNRRLPFTLERVKEAGFLMLGNKGSGLLT